MHTFVCSAVLRASQHTFRFEPDSEPSHTVHGQISLAVLKPVLTGSAYVFASILSDLIPSKRTRNV